MWCSQSVFALTGSSVSSASGLGRHDSNTDEDAGKDDSGGSVTARLRQCAMLQ
jgi:hypothetical protein